MNKDFFSRHRGIRMLLPAFFLCALSVPAYAAVKDTDVDGLSDESEISTYRTDPLNYDTDGDSIGDGEEVLDETDPLDAKDSFIAIPPAAIGIFGNPEKFPWYLARATGILSFVLLTIVVIHGLIISSRAFIRRYPPAIALEAHRFLSWFALGAVVLHFGSFLFDDFLRMSVVEIFVPFLLERDIRSAFGYDIGKATAFGIISFYLIVLLILTSEFRSKISIRVWRVVHYSSFIAYPLFLAHGILAGTDSTEWWMQVLYTVSGISVAALILIRIVSRNILPKIRARRAARQEPFPNPTGTDAVA